MGNGADSVFIKKNKLKVPRLFQMMMFINLIKEKSRPLLDSAHFSMYNVTRWEMRDEAAGSREKIDRTGIYV